MSLTVTTLVENSQGEHKCLKSEHGLSFFIEKDGHNLVFDTGQTGLLLDNAHQLKKDLSSVSHVVISHGHYDHSGGLRHLAIVGAPFELVVGQGFFNEKYALRGNAVDYLGNNFDEAFVRDMNITLAVQSEPVREIVPGVHVVTGFAGGREDETVNPRFVLRGEDGFSPDPFADEVLVAIETDKGMVVLLGCSHPGVKNMLDTVLERFDKPIYAVMGGTHLVEASDKSQEATVEYFREKNVQCVGVSHCTGEAGMGRLAALTGRYFHNCTGSSLFVD